MPVMLYYNKNDGSQAFRNGKLVLEALHLAKTTAEQRLAYLLGSPNYQRAAPLCSKYKASTGSARTVLGEGPNFVMD